VPPAPAWRLTMPISIVDQMRPRVSLIESRQDGKSDLREPYSADHK
jgi:hypothetical protein